MSKVLIAGGSGFIGSYLSDFLYSKGYEIAILSRRLNPNSPYPTYLWNYHEMNADIHAFKDVDCIINLAGAPIFDKKWTPSRKKTIYESRIASTQLLYQSIDKLQSKPKAFISASAIGYYGHGNPLKTFNEQSSVGNDYVAQVCQDWEVTADSFISLNVRTVKLRIGLVLGSNGGIIKKLLPLAKTGVLSPLGSGNQYMPWIHIEDFCRAVLYFLKNENSEGVYNMVTNEHITNSEFSKALLANFQKKPFFPSVPKFLLKLVLGERASLLLEGAKIEPNRLNSENFAFKFPQLDEALNHLLNTKQ